MLLTTTKLLIILKSIDDILGMLNCLIVCLLLFVSFSLNFSPTQISQLPVNVCCLARAIRSGDRARPLVVRNLPAKLLYQLLIRWFI